MPGKRRGPKPGRGYRMAKFRGIGPVRAMRRARARGVRRRASKPRY